MGCQRVREEVNHSLPGNRGFRDVRHGHSLHRIESVLVLVDGLDDWKGDLSYEPGPSR